MQKSIFPLKFCVLQRRACTQIQNFKRNYLENYNDSEFAGRSDLSAGSDFPVTYIMSKDRIKKALLKQELRLRKAG